MDYLLPLLHGRMKSIFDPVIVLGRAFDKEYANSPEDYVLRWYKYLANGNLDGRAQISAESVGRRNLYLSILFRRTNSLFEKLVSRTFAGRPCIIR